MNRVWVDWLFCWMPLWAELKETFSVFSAGRMFPAPRVVLESKWRNGSTGPGGSPHDWRNPSELYVELYVDLSWSGWRPDPEIQWYIHILLGYNMSIYTYIYWDNLFQTSISEYSELNLASPSMAACSICHVCHLRTDCEESTQCQHRLKFDPWTLHATWVNSWRVLVPQNHIANNQKS